MPEFVDSTVKDIDQRLVALKDEIARLEAARAALTGGGRIRARNSRASTVTTATTRRRRSATRARRGRGGATRAAQALELVRSKPGITIPQIASQIGIEPNYLYRVLPRLEQEGQVKRQDSGWVPA